MGKIFPVGREFWGGTLVFGVFFVFGAVFGVFGMHGKMKSSRLKGVWTRLEEFA